MVECEKCKQWISGDGLGLDRGKVKKMNFVCKACVEGERWEKEAKEWKKKARELENMKTGEKEQEVEEWRKGWEKRVQRLEEITEKGVQRQETESAGESQRRKGMIEGEEDREHRGGGREVMEEEGGKGGRQEMGVKGTVE